jgi:hypothetical protein
MDGNVSALINRIGGSHINWIGVRQRAGVFHAAYLILVPGLSKNDMKEFRFRMLPAPICDLATLANSRMRGKELREHVIICTFGRTDLAKFASLLSDFSFHQDGRRAFWLTRFNLPVLRKKGFKRIFAFGGWDDTTIGLKTGDKEVRYRNLTSSFTINNRPATYSIKRTVTISAIDSIKSIADFKTRIQKVLASS